MANGLEGGIISILEQARDEMRANMEAQHINASGRTSASIRVETFDGGFRLVGGNNNTHKIDDYPAILGELMQGDTAPIPTLEVGRVGGDVPRGFYYIIRQWTREKGLQFSSESERGTFAYFVARKIARSGTARSRMPANVYSEPVNKAKQSINDLLSESLTNTVRDAIGSATVTSLKGAFTT